MAPMAAAAAIKVQGGMLVSKEVTRDWSVHWIYADPDIRIWSRCKRCAAQ